MRDKFLIHYYKNNKIKESFINDELIKSHNKEVRRLNNINKNLVEEIDKLKKKNLELITENNKINKRLSSYEKHNDMPLEEEYADYYEALEKEYCE